MKLIHVIGISAVGVVMLLITMFALTQTNFYNTALIASLLVIGAPFVIHEYLTFRRSKEVEENLPDFLRDVAESNRAGMPLAKAIDNATRGSYGALSEEMTTVSSQISWGIPFEDTLLKFAGRIKSKLVRQAILIIIESHKSGGEIADILETVSNDIKIMKRIENERKSKLKVYTISMYFIFMLFLGIIVTLTTTFIPATPELNKAAGILGGSPSKLSEEDYKTFFFHLTLIEAMFAGLIAGQMGEGSALAGIKHSFILIIMTLMVFQIFLPATQFEDRIATTIIKIPASASGIQSSPSAFTIYRSITSGQVAELVKQKAEASRIKGFEWITSANIIFTESDCIPCFEGNVIVQDKSITVKRASKINYQLIGSRGIYRITISSPAA